MSETSLPPVYCDFTSVEGNAYSLMGHWAKMARKAKWPKADIDRVLERAQSSDYDALLATLLANCSMRDGE